MIKYKQDKPFHIIDQNDLRNTYEYTLYVFPFAGGISDISDEFRDGERKKTVKAEKYILCSISARLLNVGLFVILGLIIHIIQLLEKAVQAPSGVLYIMAQCRTMTEYALVTLVILIGGVLLLDCVYKGKIH